MADEQNILDQPQVDTPTDDQQPPAQQPLPEEHRKKLDAIVGQMILNKEPEDHIKAVVADFKQKYANVPVSTPEHQITEQPRSTVSTHSFFQQEPLASESTAAPKQNLPQFTQGLTNIDQMNQHVAESGKILHNEYAKNADKVIDALTEQKAHSDFYESQQPKTAKQDATYMRPILPARLPDQVKEDREAFKQAAATNPELQRAVINGLATTPKTKAALYAVDAQNRSHNANLINDNVDLIKQGKVNYNPISQKLEKPLDLVSSIVQGLKNHSNTINDFEDYKSMSDAQIIAKEEARGKDFNPDIPTDKPTGLGEEIGSNAVPLAKGVGTSLLASTAPEGVAAVAPWLGAAFSSSDFYKTAYASTLANTYHSERNKGVAPEQALATAKDRANFNANVAFVQGLAMAGTGLKMGGKVGGAYTASQSVKNIVKDLAAQSSLAGGAKVAENVKAGDNPFKDVDEAVGGNMAFMVTLGALHTALQKGSNVTKAALNKLLNESASQPQEVIDATIGKMGTTGILKPDEAQALHEKIAEVKQGSNGVPSDVPSENRSKISKLITQRTELENQMDKDHPSYVDKAYHEGIKEQINGVKKETADGKTEGKDGINEQIRKLSEPSKEPEEPIETFKKPIKASDLVLKDINAGTVKTPYKDLLEKDPSHLNGVVEELAQQIHSGNESKLLEDGYPQKTIDAIKKEYPEHQITDGGGLGIKPEHENIQTEKSFQTMDMGDMAGKPEDEAAKKHLDNVVSKGNIKPATDATDPAMQGETFDEFKNRVIPAFDKILKTEPEHTTIVTHSSVLKAMQVWDEMGRPDIDNLSEEQKQTFADKFNDSETHNGDLVTFKGDKGDIHVIRHGQTEDNAQNKFRSGNTNLTEKGIQQAKDSGKELKEITGGNVPKLITSDLPRAVHTSNLIMDEVKSKNKPSVIMPNENRPNKVITKEDTAQGKIDNLEAERKTKLKEVSKPNVRLKTIDESETKLNRKTGKKLLGKSSDGEIKYDETYDDRHEEIKTKLASLKKLVNCIWT